MAAGIVVLGALIVAIVSAGSETADGSNTRNGVIVHAPLPVARPSSRTGWKRRTAADGRPAPGQARASVPR